MSLPIHWTTYAAIRGLGKVCTDSEYHGADRNSDDAGRYKQSHLGNPLRSISRQSKDNVSIEWTADANYLGQEAGATYDVEPEDFPF